MSPISLLFRLNISILKPFCRPLELGGYKIKREFDQCRIVRNNFFIHYDQTIMLKPVQYFATLKTCQGLFLYNNKYKKITHLKLSGLLKICCCC